MEGVDARKKGRVKWFDDAKGFGFIEGGSQGDIFVHYSAIEGRGYRSLPEGAAVEYEPIQTPRGMRANKVVVLD
jgi:CspA family cold shock protein